MTMPKPRPGDLFWPVETFVFEGIGLSDLLRAWWKNSLIVSVWVKDVDGTITLADTKSELFKKVRRNMSVSVNTP